MRPSPRVRCRGCAFEWYGETAAHGLRIVGTCPRCGGELEFLVAEEEEREPPAAPRADAALDRVDPAAVLGTPTSWATMR